MKKIVLIGLILVFLAGWPSIASAENYPQLNDFSITQSQNRVKVQFSFSGVTGGLEAAEFTIGFVVIRDGALVQSDIQSGLKLKPEFVVDIKTEEGKLETTIPLFREEGLKSGDKIRYFIFLVDGQGRKSNTIIYEFELIEQWGI